MGSLKNYQSIKLHKEFVQTYSRAKKWHSKSLTIFYVKTQTQQVGFTATKKIGNAVIRNRTKRRLRALFLENIDNIKDGRYIFLAKKEIVNIDYMDLKRDFKYLLKKLNLFNEL